jgi:O-acetylhomoserine/O-acetylserine sulfhydrylase-like pyridoxal-dependent enzyme
MIYVAERILAQNKAALVRDALQPDAALRVAARGAANCQARGVLSVCDNTFASPVNQRPLEHGVDFVMHSATKSLNGHGDVTAGAVCGRREALQVVGENALAVGRHTFARKRDVAFTGLENALAASDAP